MDARFQEKMAESAVEYYSGCAEQEIQDTPSIPVEIELFVTELGRRLTGHAILIDVGCGGGRLASVVRSVGSIRYIGVDPARGMIHCARAANPHDDFRVGSAENLADVVPEKCDAFVACASLQHIPRYRIMPTLRSIHRVLRTGAPGCIVVPEGDKELVLTKREMPAFPDGQKMLFVQWPRERFAALLRRAGFRIEKSFVADEWGSLFFLVEAG